MSELPRDPLISYDKVFLSYLACGGDVERTSVVVNVPRQRIEEIAEREGWAAKLGAIERLKEEGDPQGAAIELSRTVSFVQASRMRDLVDRAMTYVAGLDVSAIVSAPGKDGAIVFTGKAVLELAKAMEVAQACCARALGDKAGGPLDTSESNKEGSRALAVFRGLSQFAGGGGPAPAAEEE